MTSIDSDCFLSCFFLRLDDTTNCAYADPEPGHRHGTSGSTDVNRFPRPLRIFPCCWCVMNAWPRWGRTEHGQAERPCNSAEADGGGSWAGGVGFCFETVLQVTWFWSICLRTAIDQLPLEICHYEVLLMNRVNTARLAVGWLVSVVPIGQASMEGQVLIQTGRPKVLSTTGEGHCHWQPRF